MFLMAKLPADRLEINIWCDKIRSFGFLRCPKGTYYDGRMMMAVMNKVQMAAELSNVQPAKQKQ